MTGKRKSFLDDHKLYAPPVYLEPAGNTTERMMPFEAEGRRPIRNSLTASTSSTTLVRNPASALVQFEQSDRRALEWNYWPQNTVIDTKGEVRWFMFANPIYDLNSLYSAGVMMGFKQNADGLLTWGFGQRYVKYDILGREVFNRRLPMRYGDFSHSMDDADNWALFPACLELQLEAR